MPVKIKQNKQNKIMGNIIYSFPPRYSAGEKVYVTAGEYCGFFAQVQRSYYYYPDGWRYFLILEENGIFEIEAEEPVPEKYLDNA